MYNQYDYFMEKGNYYEVYTSVESVEHLLDEFSKQSGIRAYHSILSTRLQLQNDKSLYHIIFIAVEVIALVITLLYLFYCVKTDTKKSRVSMAIICALHVPLEYIKKAFFEIKLLSVLAVSLIPVSLLLILGNLFIQLEITSLILLGGYILIILVLYLILLLINLMKFTKDDIAIILKDGKD